MDVKERLAAEETTALPSKEEWENRDVRFLVDNAAARLSTDRKEQPASQSGVNTGLVRKECGGRP